MKSLRGIPLLLALALLAGCQDRELPTAVAPEGAVFSHEAGHCLVINTLDGSPAPAGSLRERIEDASCTSITFDLTLPATITLTAGELEINRNLTITGPGAGSLAVSGNDASRVFRINSGRVTISGLTVTSGSASDSLENGGNIWIETGSEVFLSGLTITGGSAENDGGGIFSRGTLTITHSTISGNSAPTAGNGGGGIFNLGTLIITRSTVSGNTTTGQSAGGGIFNRGAIATLTITHSTVSGNTSHTGGGGIYNQGTLTLRNSTVSGNTTDRFGGGIANDDGTVTITNSTVSGNIALERDGGGVGNDGGGLTRILHSTISGNRAPTGGGVWSRNDTFSRIEVKGSLIWGNTLLDGTTPNDVAAVETANRYQSLGYNLIGTAGENVSFSLEFNQTGDQVNVADAKLGPLANNGGPTQTHALLAGSPALDAGDPAFQPGSLLWDQRGPGFPRRVGVRIDIGAFERRGATP